MLTAWGGVPLSVQAFRSLGAPVSVRRHVHVKQRERCHDEAAKFESFVVLNAVGGECGSGFAHLRADAGLKQMLVTRFLLRTCAKRIFGSFSQGRVL